MSWLSRRNEALNRANNNNNSLSKREQIAVIAMLGVEASNIAAPHVQTLDVDDVAERAVSMADALLAELDQQS